VLVNDEFRFSAGVLIRNITATQAFGRDTITDFTRDLSKLFKGVWGI
jgi:hypothetical protein